MGDTTIEWATKVWNPITGCTKVSEGCRHCYAERIAKRFWGERPFSDVRWHEDRLNEPLQWKKPQRVFVNSMSDLFHPMIGDGYVAAAFGVMREAKQHTFMILTKRPERMLVYLKKYPRSPAANIWLGVSVEDQKAADERIPILLQCSAAVRFVSCEPMLEKIDLDLGVCPACDGSGETGGHYFSDDGMETCDYCGGSGDAIDLDWVICGCESGPGARPMDGDWARSLRDQCQEARVPFFLKRMMVGGKLVKEPELDGRQWLEFPEVR